MADSTATIYASSGGGRIESRDLVYSNARSGSNTDAIPDGQYARVGQLLSGEPFYYCWQSSFAFSLSGIPAGSTINAATLALSPNSGDNSDTDFVIRVREHAFVSSGFTASDFVPGASLGSTGSLRAHYATSGGWTPNGSYISFSDDAMVALVSANIGGTVELLIYSDRQESNTTPTQAEYVYFGGTGDPNKPRLTVVYTPPVVLSTTGRSRRLVPPSVATSRVDDTEDDDALVLVAFLRHRLRI